MDQPAAPDGAPGAARNRVLFLESLGLRQPRLAGRDLRRMARRVERAAAGAARGRRAARAVAARRSRSTAGRASGPLNARLLRAQVGRAARELGFERPLLWSYVPQAEWLVETLQPSAIVYHCVDDIAAQKGVAAAAFRERRGALRRPRRPGARLGAGARRAHAHAQRARLLRTQRRRHRALRHRARGRPDRRRAGGAARARGSSSPARWWRPSSTSSCSRAWRGRGRAGRSRWWARSARATRTPTSRRCERLPNVHLLGARPYAALPDVLRGADAALVPYAINDLTRSVFPMKVYEYLAAGLPVVTTPLPALAGYRRGGRRRGRAARPWPPSSGLWRRTAPPRGGRARRPCAGTRGTRASMRSTPTFPALRARDRIAQPARRMRATRCASTRRCARFAAAREALLDADGWTSCSTSARTPGQYGTLLRELGFGGRLVSLEPVAEAFARAERLRGADGAWEAVRVAASDADGEITLNVTGDSRSSSVLPRNERFADKAGWAPKESRPVPARRLDGLLGELLRAARARLPQARRPGLRAPRARRRRRRARRFEALELELSVTPLYEGQPGLAEMLPLLAERGFRPGLPGADPARRRRPADGAGRPVRADVSTLVVSSYAPALGSGRAARTYGIVRALAAAGSGRPAPHPLRRATARSGLCGDRRRAPAPGEQLARRAPRRWPGRARGRPACRGPWRAASRPSLAAAAPADADGASGWSPRTRWRRSRCAGWPGAGR